ncbi:hypothetical protein GO755_29935 [Spirosoma sp. HMF4905]|uniref:Uncharacterized protein n=1 Tax=Spirosoma arboris TaxID=2682092 RepID=A0A7K1SKF6_9BACT|nr:hypothetical protein [Spirosoma arboris]MVM34289.1 hypothetical protein [Spirosoma arboris]
MEMHVLPWIKDDVAIEIIGKMIADQNRLLINVLDAFESVGFDEDSPEVQANADYQYHNQRIMLLQDEISQIYRRENTPELLEKVNTQYAPYIKGRLKTLKSFI